jgi:nuclear-control-of-ATPase protein 2
MVIDFAIQHPENGVNYTDSQVTELKMKVKQGDLTPVLKAYEHEMQSPIKNAIVGDLVRTLLIQVQKTKVDVEVAIGGIDSLLKSQELLFGFVGVAPGVLISWFLFQWVRNTFGGRKGLRQGQRKNETVRLVRYDNAFPA